MRTRFAPSPTGPLHLGHAFSALTAQNLARSLGGDCLLRIEDIDRSRSRDHWEIQILEDLRWIGIEWSGEVSRQSDNLKSYSDALQTLWDKGLIYPCSCSRRDISAALSAPQEGAPLGPDGIIYPGTCRDLSRPQQIPSDVSIRLDMAKAVEQLSEAQFTETCFRTESKTAVKIILSDLEKTVGDVVLARTDMGTSYHLSVVIDDAAQRITHVVRGEDLFDATQIHVVLQKLLGLPTPTYCHHKLIRDESGKRLAKRNDTRSLQFYREQGLTVDQIRMKIGM